MTFAPAGTGTPTPTAATRSPSTTTRASLMTRPPRASSIRAARMTMRGSAVPAGLFGVRAQFGGESVTRKARRKLKRRPARMWKRNPLALESEREFGRGGGAGGGSVGDSAVGRRRRLWEAAVHVAERLDLVGGQLYPVRAEFDDDAPRADRV